MSTPDIIAQVRSLWQIATPVAAIARRLQMDQATVRHIIQHGELPARQMTLAYPEHDESPTSGI